MPQEQDMKHIVGETQDNKPQGIHMPGVTESQTQTTAQGLSCPKGWTNHSLHIANSTVMSS